MAVKSSLGKRFVGQLLPTSTQVFLSIVLAGLVVVVARSQDIFNSFGITSQGIGSATETAGSMPGFAMFLSVSSSLVLIGFWAVIGLGAYLACWMVYSLISGARNEVAIDTGYANQGH